MPEATHWFERDGEMICEAYYKTSILWSQTMIQNDTDRMPRLEDFEPRAHAMRQLSCRAVEEGGGESCERFERGVFL